MALVPTRGTVVERIQSPCSKVGTHTGYAQQA
jgi:hypothetical protein